MSTKKTYLEENLEIFDNYIWSDSLRKFIDHEARDIILKESAKQLCKNGGKILQIGFGLGNLSYWIQEHDGLESHDIIEEHPQICELANELGYSENIIQGSWEDLYEKIFENLLDLKFDGIYFDMVQYDITDNELLRFVENVDSILKPGGIFMMYNEILSLDPRVRYKLDGYGYQPDIIEFDLSDVAKGHEDFFMVGYNKYYMNWFTKPLNNPK